MPQASGNIQKALSKRQKSKSNGIQPLSSMHSASICVPLLRTLFQTTVNTTKKELGVVALTCNLAQEAEAREQA